MKKALTLSIVIPVYNEESRLAKCLDAIASQTLMPDEVLVVDNNSTDSSVEIASNYEFVQVIHEKRQGVMFAARTGYDKAKSEIIGRIDVDTNLPKDWTQQAYNYFKNNPTIAAITGDCYFYDFPLKRLFRFLHHTVYYSIQKLISGTEILWGSNMAIKNSAWQSVKLSCQSRPEIPEDIDLSLHLHDMGFEIRRFPQLMAEVSLRRGNLGPISIISYLKPWPLTYWINKRYFQSMVIAFVLFLVWLLVLPTSVIYKLVNL